MRVLKKVMIIIGIFLLLLSGYIIFKPETFITDASTSKGWNLILVNHTHQIPDNYQIKLSELDNHEKVDARIVSNLSDMILSAKKDHIFIQINDGYRTSSSQQRLLIEHMNFYKKKGMPPFLARRYALNDVEKPGTSEHELGLAVDLAGNQRYTTNKQAYQWLCRMAYHYGFIERYPKDKKNETNIKYKPWHYRYVGKEAALKIHQNHECLEEYLNHLDTSS